MSGLEKIWIASFKIRGEEVFDLFSKETADLARYLASNPELADCLDTETMTLKKRGDRNENL